jgi:hypothetical protein
MVSEIDNGPFRIPVIRNAIRKPIGSIIDRTIIDFQFLKFHKQTHPHLYSKRQLCTIPYKTCGTKFRQHNYIEYAKMVVVSTIAATNNNTITTIYSEKHSLNARFKESILRMFSPPNNH